jgi:orotate phosphoribosyltransferase
LNSPIYCDNRQTLSYPWLRTKVRDAFTDKIKALYANVDCIAGVATGGIAQAALIAEKLELPMIYVRSESKKHGLGNQIEGAFKAGQKVVVIEDLISTGGSSLKAVESLREAGLEVLGMLAIFTYELPVAEQNFKKAQCQFETLSNYSALLKAAKETNYVGENELESLTKWRECPEKWSEQFD